METLKENDQLPEGWVKCLSKSLKGKVYYFNTLTGESLWEHPEAILLNDQAQNDKKRHLSPNHAKEKEQASLNPTNVTKKKQIRSEQKLKPLAMTTTKTGGKIKKIVKLTHIKKHLVEQSPDKSKGEEIIWKEMVRKTAISKNPITVPSQTLNAASKVQISTADAGSNKKGFNNDSKKQTGFPKRGNRTKDANDISNARKRTGALSDSGNCVSGMNEANIKNSKPNRNPAKRTLQPLRPPKKNIGPNSQPVTDARRSIVNSCYKIPRKISLPVHENPAKHFIELPSKRTSSFDRTAFANGCERSTSEISASNFRPFLSNSASSLETYSERSSPAWSMSDIAMTEVPDGGGAVECHEEDGDNVLEQDEAMDVDDAEFMAKKIFKEIESIRLERIEVPKNYTSNITSEAEQHVKIKENALFVVLDTNILLSHLKFVIELKDLPIPGAGKPTVVIPWMVVQELDRLKTAPDSRVIEFGEGEAKPFVSINVLARNAVAFLHNSFTQGHPRIKGQTVVEASETIDGFVEETNDDSILCCCLLFKRKAPESKTVLLSNDRNLCNKAIMNNVKAFTKKTLVTGLRDIFQSGNIIVHRGHFKEYFREAEVQEYLAEKQKKADELICELQCILREAMAAVVEQEMKEAYDNLWLQIVKIRPPWTLIDTLELLEKHWIAVFGQIVNRNLKEKVIQLKKNFLGGDAKLRNIDLAGELIELGFNISNAFSKHSSYEGILPKCLAALIVLQRTYKKVTSSVNLLNTAKSKDEKPKQKLRPLPQTTGYSNAGDGNRNGNTAIDVSSIAAECVSTVLHEQSKDSTSRELQVVNRPTHFAVMSTFDGIWKTVRSQSSSIFNALGYPNPYQGSDDDLHITLSKEDSLQFLLQLVPCLARLVRGIQGVLSCSLDDSMENPVIFVELGQSIDQFLNTIMCQDYVITFDELRAFCVDHLCRNALIQGLSQLDRALAMLQHCERLGS